MLTNALTAAHPDARTPRPALRPLAWLGHAARVQRERRALARLDHSRLDDLGLTPGAAWSESNRPFWDMPAQRRR